jgi:hypothetical protein
MKDYLKTVARALATAAVIAAASLLGGHANAQTAAKQPTFIQTNQWADLGNGPVEVMPIEGAGSVYTSGGGAGVTGTSAGTTTLTLSGTPAIAPCVGCVITCSPTNTAACTIPALTTVTAFNGTTTVTTSVATTVTAASLTWGAACPAATAVNVQGVSPNSVPSLGAPINLRASAGQNGVSAFPLYSSARICPYGAQGGLTFLTFPIGAH